MQASSKTHGRIHWISVTFLVCLFAKTAFASVWVDGAFDSSTPGWGVDHFSSVQAAVDAVGDTDTLYIAAGNYNESVNVRHSVIVVPTGDVKISGDFITEDRPFGHWPGDETSGGTSIYDTSGAGRAGTVYGSLVWSTDVPAVTFPDSRSLQFNGSEEVDVIADIPETNVTVSFWVKTACANCGLFSVLKGYHGGEHDRQIHLQSGNVCARIWSDETKCTSGFNVSDGAWHHIVHTYGDLAGGQIIYIDGVRGVSGTKEKSDFNWQDRFVLGLAYTAANQMLTGKLDDVRIYDRVLSATEIATLASGNRLVSVRIQGTLRVGGNIVLRGAGLDISASGTALNVGGDWVNQGGSLVAGTNNVVLDGGNQVIVGDTVFYGLTKVVSAPATLTFEAGARQTAYGLLTLQGADSAARLSLRSTAGGTQWFVDPQGGYDLLNLDVGDSFNMAAGLIDVQNKACVSAGNNDGWNFSGNDPPTFAPVGGRIVDEQSTLTFTMSAIDIDQPPGTLTFAITPALPPGASLDSNTGLFEWTPTEAQGPAELDLTAVATDNDGVTTVTKSQAFHISVREVNRAPVLAALEPTYTVDEDALLTFTATATDADEPANTLTFTLDGGAPEGASIDASTGVFTWTPADAQSPGTYWVTVRVSDDGTPPLDAFFPVQIIVNEINDPPVNTVPASLQVLSRGQVVFSQAAADPIMVFDPDIDSDALKIDLRVTDAANATQGALTLASLSGLQFTQGDGVGDAAMTFRGTQADVNAALDGLLFVPPPDSNGDLVLTITSDDQGYDRPGGPLSDVDATTLHVVTPSVVWVDDNFTRAVNGWAIDHFATIQPAIDAVAVGGAVEVAAGTYFGAVDLNVGVTVNFTGDARIEDTLTVRDGVLQAPANGTLSLGSDFMQWGAHSNIAPARLNSLAMVSAYSRPAMRCFTCA